MEIALSKYLGSQDIITPCMPIEEEELRTELGFLGPQNYGLPVREWKLNHYVDFALGHKPKRFSAHSNAKTALRYLGPENFLRYRKILTVRNPFTYVVSLYNWHARKSGPNPEGFKSWLIAGQGDLRYSNYGMGKVDGRFAMDLVLHFESIEEGIAILARELGLPRDFVTDFKSIRAKSTPGQTQLTAADAYSFFPQARDLVESMFQEEITNFDYAYPL